MPMRTICFITVLAGLISSASTVHLASKVYAGIPTATAFAVAVAVLVELSKYAFAYMGVVFVCKTKKAERIMGALLLLASVALVVLSCWGTILYTQNAHGAVQEQIKMQAVAHGIVSEAHSNAQNHIKNVDYQIKILSESIEFAKNSIDADLANGYRTRAANTIGDMERMRRELAQLHGDRLQAAQEAQAARSSAEAGVMLSANQTANAMPQNAGALLAVIIEAIGVLGAATHALSQRIGPQDGQETQEMLKSAATHKLPALKATIPPPYPEVAHLESLTTAKVRQILRCSTKKACQAVREIKEWRGQGHAQTC